MTKKNEARELKASTALQMAHVQFPVPMWVTPLASVGNHTHVTIIHILLKINFLKKIENKLEPNSV